MRILFVENHRAFRTVVVSQFLSDHEVHPASSLAGARAALAEASFECLLVDYDLDDGKGDELVESCRTSGFAGIIIGVSGHEHGNRSLLAAGADEVCPKSRFADIRLIMSDTLRRRIALVR